MIELKDYAKYCGWFVRVTLIDDQAIPEGPVIEGVFDGYDYAVCSGDEGGDSLTINMGGWGYDMYVSYIQKIEPLYKLDDKAYQDLLTRYIG
ncbi:hypothetical protein [Helicobacter suis]|uniref:hypothetical protein n=1 Tax=Helicobacter suis TaxID=104628 RepID=UPI0013D3C31B|nr:hypothetical protein [Helicobacter suis]